MTRLHVFMQIDTCPMCGNKIFPVENGYIGKKLEEIPETTVFEITCTDPTGTELTCGKFRITKRETGHRSENDWVAEYIPVELP